MSNPVSYRVFRCSIPEGGDVVLYMPAVIGRESFDMARDMLAIQMRQFERHLTPDAAMNAKGPITDEGRW